ncbi:MAG: GNAT family N-acetyltransferase [Planctomycetota bacterium]|nr:MAG: GNAT family N-acetyltransferase [Planctomycetota bacterium]
MAITYRELQPSDWPALESLFGPTGASGGCWCMWWRVERGGRLWEQTKGARAKAEFRRRVKSDAVHGILARDGARAVGWATFGPRRDFPRLETVKAFRAPDAAAVWSIPCFFIHRDYRGRGVCRGLLKASIAAARRHGARVLEAYPVTTTADGRRMASAFAYTGPLRVFEDAGFREVQRLTPTRPLVRLTLGARRKSQPPTRGG